jgi:hypothetical protein
VVLNPTNRLLSPSLLVGSGTTKVYSAHRSRHCHGINFTQIPSGKADECNRDFSSTDERLSIVSMDDSENRPDEKSERCLYAATTLSFLSFQ